MAAKTNSTKYYEVSLASIICLLFLSHLSVTICFIGLILTFYIGVFFAKLIDARNENNTIFPFSRSLLGGAFGFLLPAFWLIPYLLNGGGGFTAFMGSASTYVPPLQSLFLGDPQNIWFQSYYLGLPLICFGVLGLIVSIYKRVFWGIIFTFWTLFFLIMAMQPYFMQGLSLGYPARYPFLVSFSFSLLAGIGFDYLLSRFSKRLSSLSFKIFLRGILVLLLVSYAITVNPVIVRGYESDYRVSEDLSSHLGPYERLASVSTFSYAFNVVSNKFQIDGGYIEGNINLQFYREYWFEIYSGNDVEATINILKGINARLVLFHGQISPEVEKKFAPPYFSVLLREPPITVFELNRTLIPLNFVEVIDGNVEEVTLLYSNPDVLEFTLANCSENAELMVKMNYHEGWIAYCNNEKLPLIRNDQGFINMLVPFEGDLRISLKYDSTIVDQIGMGVTVAGVSICLFLLLRKSLKIPTSKESLCNKEKR